VVEKQDITATQGSVEEFKLLYGRMPANTEELNRFTASRGAAARKPEVIELTSDNKRTLLGAGFNENDIPNIENDVRTFGIDAVLNNLTDERQKVAVQKVYGITQRVTRDQVMRAVTKKVAADGLEKYYTKEELEKLAKDNKFGGFFTSRAKEVKNFLNSERAREIYIDLIYEQYRLAGMAD
jgi:hypothetical protein